MKRVREDNEQNKPKFLKIAGTDTRMTPSAFMDTHSEEDILGFLLGKNVIRGKNAKVIEVNPIYVTVRHIDGKLYNIILDDENKHTNTVGHLRTLLRKTTKTAERFHELFVTGEEEPLHYFHQITYKCDLHLELNGKNSHEWDGQILSMITNKERKNNSKLTDLQPYYIISGEDDSHVSTSVLKKKKLKFNDDHHVMTKKPLRGNFNRISLKVGIQYSQSLQIGIINLTQALNYEEDADAWWENAELCNKIYPFVLDINGIICYADKENKGCEEKVAKIADGQIITIEANLSTQTLNLFIDGKPQLNNEDLQMVMPETDELRWYVIMPDLHKPSCVQIV